MYVCVCQGVTERQIRAAIGDGAQSMRDLRRELGVASCCGRCAVEVRGLLREAVEPELPPLADAGALAYPAA